jgi:hypothetical protein
MSITCQQEITYLATGLDPDKSIDERVVGVGSRSDTEASALDVAPISPSLLASRLLTAAASVNNEVGWEAFGTEQKR